MNESEIMPFDCNEFTLSYSRSQSKGDIPIQVLSISFIFRTEGSIVERLPIIIDDEFRNSFTQPCLLLQ